MFGIKPVYNLGSDFAHPKFSKFELMTSKDYLRVAQTHIDKASKVDVKKHPIIGSVFFGYHTSRALRNIEKAQKPRDATSLDNPYDNIIASEVAKKFIGTIAKMNTYYFPVKIRQPLPPDGYHLDGCNLVKD